MEKKELILNYLKRFKRMPTSKIAVLIGLPYKNTLKLLEELNNENEVVKIKETNATYWSRRCKK